jgi:hypothetical protein
MAHDANDPAPNLLAHLEQALGLTEPQALDALGQYLMTTKAGRALARDLRARRNQARDAA